MSTDLKRIEVKYVRDGIKAYYPKKYNCKICNTTEELENHHYRTVTRVWHAWLKEKGIRITDAEHIMEIRYDFYKDHWDDLIKEVVCLCKKHHSYLHVVYGKDPMLSTAEKQKRWVAKQRDKYGLPPDSIECSE